jgi:hypothetical protein
MNNAGLNRKIVDLTVLELQELLDAMESRGYMDLCPPPEEIDIASKVGQLNVGQFITVFTHSLPRGLPKP